MKTKQLTDTMAGQQQRVLALAHSLEAIGLQMKKPSPSKEQFDIRLGKTNMHCTTIDHMTSIGDFIAPTPTRTLLITPIVCLADLKWAR